MVRTLIITVCYKLMFHEIRSVCSIHHLHQEHSRNCLKHATPNSRKSEKRSQNEITILIRQIRRTDTCSFQLTTLIIAEKDFKIV